VVQPHLTSAAARYEVVEHLRPHLYALTVESLIRRVQERVGKHIVHRQSRRAA